MKILFQTTAQISQLPLRKKNTFLFSICFFASYNHCHTSQYDSTLAECYKRCIRDELDDQTDSLVLLWK